jgi:hypothetical protein
MTAMALNRVPYSIDNRAIHSVSRGELNRRLLRSGELPNVKLISTTAVRIQSGHAMHLPQ